MNFVTVSELDRDIIHNLHKIPENIDVIAGVPRSGMLAASLIALHLNRPLTDIDSLASGKIYSSGSTKNVPEKTASGMQAALVVEDSTLSGRSLMEAKKTLRQAGCSMKCIFLAVYAVGEARHNADIYFRIIPRPRAFEWNFMHYPEFLKRACVDIDGVLCMDPSPEENDDGEKYREFIRNARVKFVPTAEIGWIVTSRLENTVKTRNTGWKSMESDTAASACWAWNPRRKEGASAFMQNSRRKYIKMQGTQPAS